MKFAMLMGLSSLVLLSACSQKTALNYDECHFPDSPSSAAPGWVCEQPVDGLSIQAVGYSRKLLSGSGMMTDVAATEARNRLANEFSSQIQGRLSRLTTDTKTDTQATDKTSSVVNSVDKVERIQKQLSAMTLTHSKIYRTLVSPAGGMYVLVGLDKKHYDENVNALVNNALSDKDSPELYQKFLKQQADQSLDKIRQQLQ